MSLFAVAWQRDAAPLPADAVDRVVQRMASRPADGVGRWQAGPLALIHWLLRTSADSAPIVLPIRSDDGQLLLTGDVRLDNRDELLAALDLGATTREEMGDAALVLRAWERWAESCPARLMGDFAFALFDARRQLLFCARDQMGVRPFYYHLSPRLFAAASETRALLAMPGVPRVVDEVQIASFLVPGFEDRTRTSFDGVRRLPAGHALVVAAGQSTVWAYWQLDQTREAPPATDEEYAGEFLRIFTEAVRSRLHAASPVAAALSGGLDSSAVVCVSRTLRPTGSGALRAYTARFPTLPDCDEGAYVDAVARQGGVDVRELRGDLLDPLGDAEEAADERDDSFHAPGYYMHRALFRAARADGVRVFLEGMCGDSTVSHGAGHLYALAQRFHWLTLGRELWRLSSPDAPWWQTLRGVVAGSAPGSLRRSWRRLRHRRPGTPAIVRAEFAGRVQLADRLRDSEVWTIPWNVDGVRAQHARVNVSPRLASVLESLAASAAWSGVEVRDPFSDPRLVEFCVALPASQKIRDGETRIVARRALGRLLPHEIVERRGKARLELMLGQALVVYGPVRLERLMHDAEEILGPYVPGETIRDMYRAYQRRPSRANRNGVWRLAVLALWLRRNA